MQGRTALVCISTPGGQDNLYTRLLTAKDPKTEIPVFHSVRIGGVCEECAKDPVRAVLCSHVQAEVPRWISSARRTRFEPLYEGQTHTYQREFLGLVADAGGAFLREEFIAPLETAERVGCPVSPYIFLGIDQSGGGKSEMAVVAIVPSHGNLVVQGMGSTHVGDQIDRETAFLQTLIALLRQRVELASAKIIVACEGAPGNAAAVIAGNLRAQHRVYFLREVGGQRIGVPIDDRLMEKMANNLQMVLAASQLMFSKEMVVMAGDGQGERGLLRKLFNQLRNLGWKLVTKRLDNERFKLTAKVAGDSADLIMALMHALYWEKWFLLSDHPEYIAIRHMK